MIIDIIDERPYLKKSDEELIRDLIRLAAEHLDLADDFELSISFVDQEEIHRLNRDFRQVDAPTDVISFAIEADHVEGEPEGFFIDTGLDRLLGDIVISYPQLLIQAEEYDHSIERELGFLVVHGFLHLNGYDHQTPEEEEEMFTLQEEVIQAYDLDR